MGDAPETNDEREDRPVQEFLEWAVDRWRHGKFPNEKSNLGV